MQAMGSVMELGSASSMQAARDKQLATRKRAGVDGGMHVRQSWAVRRADEASERQISTRGREVPSGTWQHHGKRCWDLESKDN